MAPDGKQALATIDIEDKYAPIPEGTRAILRTKTLLGETYVELTPGNRDGPKLARRRHPAGGQRRRIGPARRDLPHLRPAAPAPPSRNGCRNAAVAIEGRGQDLSNAFAELDPTFTEFDQLFRVLDTQQLAVKQLFSNGAVALQRLARPRRRSSPT